MSVNQRTHDILLGALFGVILGLMSSLWASVYARLFIANASITVLYENFILSSFGLIVMCYILWIWAKRLGEVEEAHKT
jgi:hypothetical protein